MSDKAAQYKQQQSEFEVPKFDAEGKPLSKNEQKERFIFAQSRLFSSVTLLLLSSLSRENDPLN
jgi:hypothetical protein